MTNTTRTQVSKAHPAIKAILAVTFPNWTGRKVIVIQTGEGWEHTQYVDDSTSAVYVNLETMQTCMAARPGYTSGPVTHKPTTATALVMLSRFMGQDMGVEIVIQDRGIDMTVATDAALAGQGSKRVRACVDAALADDTLHNSAAMHGGILSAVVEATAKKIEKAAAKHAAADDGNQWARAALEAGTL